jgi:hypothetical protein
MSEIEAVEAKINVGDLIFVNHIAYYGVARVLKNNKYHTVDVKFIFGGNAKFGRLRFYYNEVRKITEEEAMLIILEE